MNWRLPNQHRTFSEDGALFTVCDHCGNECVPESPCRCCETARANEAERALDRVREFCEQQVKDRSGSSKDRDRFDLSYIDGWNDALDNVEQVLDGGAE